MSPDRMSPGRMSPDRRSTPGEPRMRLDRFVRWTRTDGGNRQAQLDEL